MVSSHKNTSADVSGTCLRIYERGSVSVQRWENTCNQLSTSVLCWSLSWFSLLYYPLLSSHCSSFSPAHFFLHSLSPSIRLIAKQQWQPWQICALAHTVSHLTLANPLPHKHTYTHMLYNQMPCWFAVYDTKPHPPLEMAPWSAPPHWGDRREASSWMELLCSSPEGFDPLPFIPQISACPASLERGLGPSLI